MDIKKQLTLVICTLVIFMGLLFLLQTDSNDEINLTSCTQIDMVIDFNSLRG